MLKPLSNNTIQQNTSKTILTKRAPDSNLQSTKEAYLTPKKRNQKLNIKEIKNFKQKEAHLLFSDVDKENQQNSKQDHTNKVIYTNGEYYIGDIDMNTNKRSGKGMYYYDNGQIMYKGNFLDNKRHGFGILFDQQGHMRYKGSWKLNKGHGRGKIYYPEKKILYDGELCSGQKHGFGKQYNFCLDQTENQENNLGLTIFLEYVGEFEANEKNQNGSYYQPNGVHHEISFNRNEKKFKMMKNRYGEIIGYE